MHRLEGRVLIAWWLLVTASMAVLELLAALPALRAHPAGWRAAAGPALVASLSVLAALQLLRHGRGFTLAALVLGLEVLAVSAGPFAYRLDVGPFLRLTLSGHGLSASAGSGAHLLLIVGASNRVAPGLALNVLAASGLLMLLACRRSSPRMATG